MFLSVMVHLWLNQPRLPNHIWGSQCHSKMALTYPYLLLCVEILESLTSVFDISWAFTFWLITILNFCSGTDCCQHMFTSLNFITKKVRRSSSSNSSGSGSSSKTNSSASDGFGGSSGGDQYFLFTSDTAPSNVKVIKYRMFIYNQNPCMINQKRL